MTKRQEVTRRWENIAHSVFHSFTLFLSNGNFPLLFRECDFFVTVTHHSSVSPSSCVGSSGFGPLPPLTEQRVVGHVQVFDLHLVIVDTHGGQGTGHFLLFGDIACCKSGALLPPCAHILKLNRVPPSHRPTAPCPLSKHERCARVSEGPPSTAAVI